MTGYMVAHGERQGPKVAFEPARLVQLPQKSGKLHGAFGDDTCVRVVDQIHVILTEHNGRGWLRAQYDIAFAGKVGQNAEIYLCRLACGLSIPLRERRHAAADLAGWNEYVVA